MTNFTRRHFVLGAAGLAGAAVLTACGGDEPTPADPTQPGTTDPGTPETTPADETSPAVEETSEAPQTVDPIKVGYIADANGTTLITVAEHLGLWEKHGLDAETISFTNGPLQIQALGTGDLDFGYIGFGALWLPMTGQAKVVAIQSRGLADRVIAQPGLTSIEDLRGKRVGVPEGTSGDILLGLALEKAGMSVSDIERLAMDAPTAISAFSSGQIDGAGIWHPHVATIQQQVPDLVEVANSADFADLAFLACQVAAPSITERPEILKKYQAVAKEALTWASENKEELTQLLSDAIDVPVESLSGELEHVQMYSAQEVIDLDADGSIEGFLRGLNQVFVDQEKTPEVVDPATYWLSQEYADA